MESVVCNELQRRAGDELRLGTSVGSLNVCGGRVVVSPFVTHSHEFAICAVAEHVLLDS